MLNSQATAFIPPRSASSTKFTILQGGENNNNEQGTTSGLVSVGTKLFGTQVAAYRNAVEALQVALGRSPL